MTTTLQITEKLPPSAIEEEIQLLGILMVNPDIAPKVTESLEVQHFYSTFAQQVYSAICQLVRAEIKPAMNFVYRYLLDNGCPRPEEMRSQLAKCVDSFVYSDGFQQIAAIIKEKYRLRQIISLCDRMTSCAYGAAIAEDSSDDILRRYLEEMLNLQKEQSDRHQIKHAGEIFSEVFTELDSENTGDDTAVASTLPTGMPDIDMITGGMPIGALTVVGGRGGMGKSTFALDVGLKVAKTGKSVVYFSLEMTASQMMRKSIANIASPNVSVGDLFRPNGIVTKWDSVVQAGRVISDLDFWIQDRSSININQIRADIQEVAVRNGRGQVDLVVIDYVGLVDPDRSNNRGYGNRVLEVDAILKGLRAIAKDYNCVVLGLAQINRAVEGRSDKRPTKSDFRESGGFENESVMMLGLYRDEYYDKETQDKGIMEISVLKSRFSEETSTKVLFDTQFGTFSSASVPRSSSYD